jgi:hypothetical protein
LIAFWIGGFDLATLGVQHVEEAVIALIFAPLIDHSSKRRLKL